MSSNNSPTLPLPAGEVEPKTGRAAVPVWLFVLLFLLLFWAMVYFDQRGGWFDSRVYTPYYSLGDVQKFQPPAGGVDLMRGRAVYENVCGLCHNNDGTGKPNQAPPLAASEWVAASPARVIRIPQVGLSGPIQVKGQDWNLSMAAMGAPLSDDDLAAVLTYIRKSWGNNASEITPEQVKKVRAEVGNRSQPWSAAELNAIQ